MTSKQFNEVFVIYGRNTKIRDSMYEFLKALGLKPVTFEEAKRRTGLGSPTIMDILDNAITKDMAILSLYTPDDIGFMNPYFHKNSDSEIEKRPVGQARQNVIFETALALAKNRNRTILVFFGEVKKYSDISWIHYVQFDDTPKIRTQLKDQLKSIDCPVQENSNYLNVGDFGIESDIIQNLPSTPYFTSIQAELINAIKSLGTLSIRIIRNEATNKEKEKFNYYIKYVHRNPKIAALLPRYISEETDAYILHKTFKEYGSYKERVIELENDFSGSFSRIKELLNL